MKRFAIITLVMMALTGLYGSRASWAAQDHPATPTTSHHEELMLKNSTGVETEAAFFKGSQKQAVIFAPGAMFSKKSWFFLNSRLQKLGIASISLNSGSVVDLANAVAFLNRKKFKSIAIVGASISNVSVIEYLSKSPDPAINKVIMLAPAANTPLKDSPIRKLFIAAEDDMITSAAEVYNIFYASSEPKTWKEFPADAHAQRLFDTEFREELIQTIIDFIQARK